MDRSTLITLVNETYSKDIYGVDRKTTTESEVFAQVDSVTRQEFFDAGRNGLNPEYVFRVFSEDYNGERTVRYNGRQFAVYRTFLGRNDIMELYAERQGGVNEG